MVPPEKRENPEYPENLEYLEYLQKLENPESHKKTPTEQQRSVSVLLLYPEPGSNRHGLPHWCLRPARLPIPPSGLIAVQRYGKKSFAPNICSGFALRGGFFVRWAAISLGAGSVLSRAVLVVLSDLFVVVSAIRHVLGYFWEKEGQHVGRKLYLSGRITYPSWM